MSWTASNASSLSTDRTWSWSVRSATNRRTDRGKSTSVRPRLSTVTSWPFLTKSLTKA